MFVALFGRRGSVRRRLIVWNVGTLMALFAGLGVVARYTLGSTIMASIDRDLTRRADMMSHNPHGGPFGPPGLPPGSQPGERRRDGPGHLPPGMQNDPYPPIDFNSNGAIIGGLSNSPYDQRGLVEAMLGTRTIRTLNFNGDSVRVMTVSAHRGENGWGALQIAYPLDDMNRALAGSDRTLLALFPLALAVSLLGGVLVTGRVLRRVHAIAASAESIGTQDLSKRLATGGDDEFSDLAATINGMLARLEGAFTDLTQALDRQRRFTADASHELRTPLTVIKGSASYARERASGDEATHTALAEIDRSADAMVALVNDLLILASSDGGQLGLGGVRLLMHGVLTSATANASAAHPQTHISLDLEDDAMAVDGNESELIRLFSNLLDNAARYGSHVTVTARQDGATARVVVADDGPGITAEAIAHLGERFFRVDESRTGSTGGSGLGISICLGIVQAHFGSLRFESDLGAGTKAIVELPAAV